MAYSDSLCANCPEPHSKLCAGCQAIHYCSKECQKADRSTHKLLCSSFKEFEATKKPTKDHWRAILFPIDEQKPRFIWVVGEWQIFLGRARYLPYDVKELLDGDYGSSLWVEDNARLGRDLKDCVQIRYRDNFL